MTFLLCACSSLVSQQKNTPLPSDITKLKSWTVKGKVSIKTPKQNLSGYFYWQKEEDLIHFSLNSFIGTNILTLNTQNNLSVLEIDDKTYRDKNPSLLIQKTTGLYLPITNLEFWIRGQLTGNEKNVLKSDSKISQFTYTSGKRKWLVQFKDYQPQDIYLLPKTISLTSKNTKLKLSVSSWEF